MKIVSRAAYHAIIQSTPLSCPLLIFSAITTKSAAIKTIRLLHPLYARAVVTPSLSNIIYFTFFYRAVMFFALLYVLCAGHSTLSPTNPQSSFYIALLLLSNDVVSFTGWLELMRRIKDISRVREKRGKVNEISFKSGEKYILYFMRRSRYWQWKTILWTFMFFFYFSIFLLRCNMRRGRRLTLTEFWKKLTFASSCSFGRVVFQLTVQPEWDWSRFLLCYICTV